MSAYQSYKSTGRVDWKQAGKAAIGGVAAAVSVGAAVATGGAAAGAAVLATEAISGGLAALHGGNAADVSSSMGTSGAMAAVGGQALAKAPAVVKTAVGVVSMVAGANQTSKNVKTAKQTLNDKNATTQQKAAAVADAAVSAAGTIGSAMLAASSASDAAQELAAAKSYYQKAHCPDAGKAASGGVSSTNTPNANTLVISHGETKSNQQIKAANVTDYWDSYLGSNQTNINPRTGEVDPNRIFSSDGSKSIRFGNHEMNSMGTTKFHFHEESWIYDATTDEVHYYNTLIRIKD